MFVCPCVVNASKANVRLTVRPSTAAIGAAALEARRYGAFASAGDGSVEWEGGGGGAAAGVGAYMTTSTEAALRTATATTASTATAHPPDDLLVTTTRICTRVAGKWKCILSVAFTTEYYVPEISKF